MRWLPILLLAVSMLAACGHSRVVHRDYDVDGSASSRTARNHPRASSRAQLSTLPSDAVHVVRSGETLYGISFRFGLRYQDVAAWNGIYDPYVIEIGQRLRLRPPTSDRRTASLPPRPVAQPPTQAPPASTRGNPTMPPTPAVPVATMPATPTLPRASPAYPPAAGIGPVWRWPVQGQIIGRYVGGDQTRQGINIAGSAGQLIAAAADGIVVYSGAGLAGYGELIIIKHSEEWLSAYAHNRRRLVVEGTRVKSGDPIAEMGRTGAAREMLHFEIRRNGKPVDPLGFLPRQ